MCVAIQFSVLAECPAEQTNLQQNTHIGSATTSYISVAPSLPATFHHKSNFHPYS
jgi:hypothetical protein